jgi:hypothetical protein
MAFGSTVCVPGNTSFNALFSVEYGTLQSLQLVVTAKNPDGTPFDFTATTGVQLGTFNQQQVPFNLGAYSDLVVLSKTATQLVVLLEDPTIRAACFMVARSGIFSIQITDGVTQLIAAIGTYNIQTVA